MRSPYQPLAVLGGSFGHYGLAPGAVSVLVAAAANTKGLILRHLAVYCVGGGVSVYANPLPPTAITDGAARAILLWNNGVNTLPGHLPLPMLVPAGSGLFAWSTNAGNTLSVGYDLL